jgi:DNA-binding transcriptional ArsR family regulator
VSGLGQPQGAIVRTLRQRVGSLAGEIAEVGAALERLAEQVEASAATDTGESLGSDQHLLMLARAIVACRSARVRHFSPGLFAEPAWDMLLDLFIADLTHTTVCVSSLCIASGVPPTTALRWIAMLDEAGVVVRRPDPDDGRRILVALSDLGFDGVRKTILTEPTGRPGASLSLAG